MWKMTENQSTGVSLRLFEQSFALNAILKIYNIPIQFFQL